MKIQMVPFSFVKYYSVYPVEQCLEHLSAVIADYSSNDRSFVRLIITRNNVDNVEFVIPVALSSSSITLVLAVGSIVKVANGDTLIIARIGLAYKVVFYTLLCLVTALLIFYLDIIFINIVFSIILLLFIFELARNVRRLHTELRSHILKLEQ